MSEELKTLLGDGAAVAAVVGNFEIPTVVEESPTVLKVDRWTRRAGERVLGQWVEADVDTLKDATVDDAADAIETLLSSAPKLAERPKDQPKARWWKQLMDAPECAALRARTVCAPAIAEIAAAELANQWLAYAAEQSEPQDGNGNGEGQGDGSNESAEASVARIRSTRDALAQASEAAADAEAIGAGLGLGTETSLDASVLANYTRRLRASGNVAAIMRMAGRFIAKAKQLQRQRTNLPGMEITGVELSGDLSRLLPVEASLVAGAIPELETLAMKRLIDRRALSYRRITREPVAMGPIVVSVDESGSMGGDPIAAAKGLALAMASIARAQKRPFLLCAFSGTSDIRTASGSAGAVVEWCELFMNGGTVLDGPLHTLPSTSWPAGPIGAAADHIIITDANVGLSDDLRDSYRAWAKTMGVRTFGIGIGVSHLSHLEQVCDGGSWCLPELDLNNPAVDVILSIGPTHKEVRS